MTKEKKERVKRIKKIFTATLKFLKKRWLLVLIVLLILGGAGWYMSARAAGEKPKNSYIVKKQTLRETITFSGNIDAEEKATLRFQTSGKLAWVGVKVGDTVQPYQGVASLDQAELRKRLQKDLNTYVKTRLDFDQQQRDINQWGTPWGLDPSDMDTLLTAAKQEQYTLDNSVLDVEIANITLKLANLYSPISGIVTRIGSKVAGVNVTPAQAEFEIVNPETLYFSASVDQTDVVKLVEGMGGEVILDAFPDGQMLGEITSISFAPDEDETGTVYTVKLTLDDVASDAAQFRLGMTGDSTFTLKERVNSIAVPTTYIKYEKGKPYVLKKVNNKPEKTFIKVGEEIDTATIVRSGLVAGDVVYD